MKIAKTKAEVREGTNGRDVGFVPTMGALHAGHLSLVGESRSRGLFTAVSIFVNPTQFNNPEDLLKYPVDLDRDCEMLRSAGCDLVFIPERDEMYPPGQDEAPFLHDFGDLETRFEGHYRPGHFRGVGQVVHKLFEIVAPQWAFFGEKDFQQLQVIRRLVEIIGMPCEIVGMPTIREKDGLALSSRNRRLEETDRQTALILYRALEYAKESIGKAALHEIRAQVERMFQDERGAELEYFDMIDAQTFVPIQSFDDQVETRGIIAAYVGGVRLIDNMALL